MSAYRMSKYETIEFHNLISVKSLFLTRESPCDSYDCSGIANSECIAPDDDAFCTCEVNFDTYALDTYGAYFMNNSMLYFSNDSSTHCCPAFPCAAVRKCSEIFVI